MKAQHQPSSAEQKFDILLVDDRAENLLALEAVLSDMGQNLLTARSGEGALKHLLRPNDFAVVVLDAHMPGMDGFETARQIRSRKSSQSLPIIFVTAVHQSDQYALRAYSLGAVDYVCKPFDPEALKAKVRVFVELARKSREVETQAELLRLTNQELEHRVRQRTAELEKANQELRVLFRQSPHPKWVCDLSSLSFLAVNRAATRSYGYSEDEFLRMTLRDLRPAEDIPELMERVEQLRRGEPVEALFRHRKKDGSWIWAETAAHPIQFEGRPAALVVATDVTRRRQAEQALRASERQYRQIVETAREGIWLVDHQWRTRYVNPAFCRMLGYGAEELLGESPFKLLFEEDYSWARAQVELRQQGIAEQSEVRLRHKDGSFLWTISQTSPLVDEQGNFAGALAMVSDITERKRAEEERSRLLASERAARERAEAASRAKDELVAMVSHEVRSPLNVILGWASMLRTGKTDPAQTARAVEIIERNAKAQALLVEDLLDVSRVITGKLFLNVCPVDPARVVEAALDSVRPAADAKSIQLLVHLEPRGSMVSGDPNRLQQVVWNLVSNAVKFTPRHGRIEVRVERINSHLQITVSDSGAGINPEFLPIVFDRFSQASTGSARKYSGLGLGLAIVRHLVELHGGAVRADSPGEGRGATFTVTLPVRADREEMSPLPRTGASAEGAASLTDAIMLDGLRVLVVDDQAETRDLLTAMLAQRGAIVKACASAAEALEAVEQWRPLVLVSDIGMPDEDGYALIRKLRALEPERGGNTPAVALTAYARTEDRLRALAAGFQTHVPKPVEAPELILTIASLAGRKGRMA